MQLSKEQQRTYDGLILLLEQENISPVLGLQILTSHKVADIFMLPEDIEDCQLCEQKVFFTPEEFRRLSYFVKFAHENSIFDLEKMLNISDNALIGNLTVHNIIEIFTQSTEQDWKKNPKRYLRYYLIIEAEYTSQTGEELSFKGLTENPEYEQNLGI